MLLSPRALNRTLWLRQHLVERSSLDVFAMVEHLIGLQAQENLPPYLSLAARLDGFEPAALSDLIASRRLVRLLSLRGTVHVLTPSDALSLRPWVQPALDRLGRSNQQSRPAGHLASVDLLAACQRLLADGPLPLAALGSGLADEFPGVPETALRSLVRERLPLLQTPPRGLWKQSGGVVYQLADRWLGERFTEPHLPLLVRRYLGAFGPATAADLTTWSGVTGLGPVVEAVDDLQVHRDEAGKVLYDVPGAVLADDDVELPVRLLGKYDNLWLSHAARDRVTTPGNRKRWMGANGGVSNTVFVDGMLEGLWTVADGRIELELFRDLTASERASLDHEVARVQALLAGD